MTAQRDYSAFDQLLMQVDNALRTLSGQVQLTERANPADLVTTKPSQQAAPSQARDDKTARQGEQSEFSESARLMRINHAGEVAAQGLYQGQSLTARLPEVRQQMQRAAQEENDHLKWCRQRCEELGSHVSYLDPLWYLGSLTIGALAGAIGDKWSLGFVAETERQVVQHLDGHLQRLPHDDTKSRAILEQMKDDELQHATNAMAAGAAELPTPIKRAMRTVSRIMTRTSYWV